MKPKADRLQAAVILFTVFFLELSAFAPVAKAQVLGSFTATGNMTKARQFASATLLANGQVLIAGGGTADIYEPNTGIFTTLGNHGSGISTLLSDGRVLFIVTNSAGKNRAKILILPAELSLHPGTLLRAR